MLSYARHSFHSTTLYLKIVPTGEHRRALAEKRERGREGERERGTARDREGEGGKESESESEREGEVHCACSQTPQLTNPRTPWY